MYRLIQVSALSCILLSACSKESVPPDSSPTTVSQNTPAATSQTNSPPAAVSDLTTQPSGENPFLPDSSEPPRANPAEINPPAEPANEEPVPPAADPVVPPVTPPEKTPPAAQPQATDVGKSDMELQSFQLGNVSYTIMLPKFSDIETIEDSAMITNADENFMLRIMVGQIDPAKGVNYAAFGPVGPRNSSKGEVVEKTKDSVLATDGDNGGFRFGLNRTVGGTKFRLESLWLPGRKYSKAECLKMMKSAQTMDLSKP